MSEIQENFVVVVASESIASVRYRKALPLTKAWIRKMTRQTSTQLRELPETITIPADGRILFFARDRDTFFFLSHFHPAEIVIGDESWPTAEHYYQSRKSLDPGFREAIRACAHAGHAKRLGAEPDGPKRHSGQSWFRAHNQNVREDWAAIRLDVMRQADMAKFSQHLRLREFLLATGDAKIVEDTALDAYWGIGADGMGDDWAGRILMEVRDELRSKLPRVAE